MRINWSLVVSKQCRRKHATSTVRAGSLVGVRAASELAFVHCRAAWCASNSVPCIRSARAVRPRQTLGAKLVVEDCTEEDEQGRRDSPHVAGAWAASCVNGPGAGGGGGGAGARLAASRFAAASSSTASLRSSCCRRERSTRVSAASLIFGKITFANSGQAQRSGCHFLAAAFQAARICCSFASRGTPRRMYGFTVTASYALTDGALGAQPAFARSVSVQAQGAQWGRQNWRRGGQRCSARRISPQKGGQLRTGRLQREALYGRDTRTRGGRRGISSDALRRPNPWISD